MQVHSQVNTDYDVKRMRHIPVLPDNEPDLISHCAGVLSWLSYSSIVITAIYSGGEV